MTASLTLPARAKLNLTLDVTGKRPDGYHDMLMVMQSVTLCDDVYITVNPGQGIRAACDKPGLPKDLENLAGRAADALLSHLGISDISVDIKITKRIPDRAGLAGGSSDAAAVLRGLNQLLGAGLDIPALCRIGETVGSDVPYCVAGGTALVSGRGEKVRLLPPMPDALIAIVKPEFSVSTPQLFRALDETQVPRRPDTGLFLERLSSGQLGTLSGLFVNVFEAALPAEQRGTVDAIKRELMDLGAIGASMTGTGSAVYGVFAPDANIDTARLDPLGDVFLTRPTDGYLRKS